MTRVAGTLDAGLSRSPMQWVAARTAVNRLAVLAYHDVTDARSFGAHLDHLVRCATPVSVEDVRASLRGRPLPPRPVLVTFDDGDRSVLDTALPLLRERSIPAVAFVVAALVGTDTPPWWRQAEALVAAGARLGDQFPSTPGAAVRHLKTLDERARRETLDALREAAPQAAPSQPQLSAADLRTLEAGGVAVGNHTLTHPCLDRCDDGTLEREISDAHALLGETLGHPPAVFAYPNGDWDPRAEAVLQRCGYELAFLFDHRLASLPIRSRFRVSRVRVDSVTSLDRFRLIVSGLHPALHRALGRR